MIDFRQPPAPISENLLTNPGLEIWQRGNGPFSGNGYNADGWQIILGLGGAATVTRDNIVTEPAGAAYCAQVVYTHGSNDSALYQKLERYLTLRTRAITFAARVSAAVANAVRLEISDGSTIVASSLHPGGGVWRTLTVTTVLAAGATACLLRVALRASGTFYVDSATLVVGSIPLPYSPLHPADDLARCLRYYREFGGMDAVEGVAAGLCFTATGAMFVVVYPVEMAVTPTVTFTAPGGWSPIGAGGGGIAATAMAAANVTRRSTRITATVASGLTAGNGSILAANGISARIYIEGNP